MRQGAFLAAYAKTARINRAAEAAEVDRSTHYDWLANDPEYSDMFIKARAMAAQQLEDEAVRRAVEGCDRPLGVAGQVVQVREFSDTLLIFLLKGMMPEKYRERSSVEHSGPGGAPLLDLTAVDEFLRRSGSG